MERGEKGRKGRLTYTVGRQGLKMISKLYLRDYPGRPREDAVLILDTAQEYLTAEGLSSHVHGHEYIEYKVGTIPVVAELLSGHVENVTGLANQWTCGSILDLSEMSVDQGQTREMATQVDFASGPGSTVSTQVDFGMSVGWPKQCPACDDWFKDKFSMYNHKRRGRCLPKANAA